MPVTLDPARITTDHAAYAATRTDERARMIAVRRGRRIRVGDMLAFAFENAETLAYQVQEMVFTERLTDPADVAHELELYERMLPDAHSLVATMLVELTDPATIKNELARLEGLQRSISLEIGTGSDRLLVRGEEIPGPDEDPDVPSTLVSVHVLRFRLTDAARDAFRDPAVPALLVVDHEGYADDAPISGDTRTALLADLTLQP
jgi:hypothetical protein